MKLSQILIAFSSIDERWDAGRESGTDDHLGHMPHDTCERFARRAALDQSPDRRSIATNVQPATPWMGRASRNSFRPSSSPRWSASSDPATLVRLVLRGGRNVATAGEPTAPGMPSFGWQLDDAQVAAVVTYIRNARGLTAPPVSAQDVNRARSALRGRTD
jgi:hypothetical protein